jgi:hypothetical protein
LQIQTTSESGNKSVSGNQSSRDEVFEPGWNSIYVLLLTASNNGNLP